MEKRKVKITKIGVASEPFNPQLEKYPIGVEHVGKLVNEVKVGEMVFLDKDGNGFFRTSVVKEIISDDIFRTQNTIYQIEDVE